MGDLGYNATSTLTAPYIAVGATLCAISAGFVILRLFHGSTAGNKKLSVDDYLSFVGLVLLIAYFLLYTFESLNTVETVQWVEQDAIVLTLVSLPGTFFAKAPILVLYKRIFGVKPWFRNASMGTLFAMALVYVVLLAVEAGLYATRGGPEDLEALVRFEMSTIAVGITSSVVAIINDIVIILLPLPVIQSLNLPFSRKVGIAAIFLTGIFGLASSIVALYYKVRSLRGDESGQAIALLAATIECSIAIIVGCIPAARGQWNKSRLADVALGINAFSTVRHLSSVKRSARRNDENESGDSHDADRNASWLELSDGNSAKALV